MKKSFLIFLLPFSAFCQDVDVPLVNTNQSIQVIIETVSGSTFGNTKTINTTLSFLPFVYFSNDFGVRLSVSDGKWSVSQPNAVHPANNTSANNVSTSGSYNARPVKIGDYYYPYRYFPSVCSIFRLVEIAYQSNLSPSAFTQTGAIGSAIFCNVSLSRLLSDSLTSTNGQFRSTVVGLLSGIYSELQAFRSDFDDFGSLNYDILDTLNKLNNSYSYVHYFDVLSFTNSLSFAKSKGYISQSEYDMRLRDYNALSSDPSSQLQYVRDFQSYLDSSRILSDRVAAALNNPDTSELGNKFNQGLTDSINAGVLGAASFHGATTNLLQRMTNQTEQIKSDLQSWRTDATNRLDRQWEGIKKIQDNTGDTAANVSTIVNSGVKISGPVQVTIGTDNLSVDIANTDLETLVQGFADGSDSAIQKWLDEWDLFKDSQLPYMARFSSFIESNTNILSSIDSKLDLSYTNVFSLIYNQLTNNVSTNNLSALLLDDYETFIDSSKYSSLVSLLPDDLCAALSSFGFSDSSEYSGRWWVFQSANMALQSQLALTNAALSSTLLNALSAIDDSDDSGGSLLSRWLSLIDSIPDPEEIQQYLAEATNIVSNIGFERVDTLYATATQDLVSVVKGIYQDKSLPSNIRFVFIPANDGRDEKYVDIPVGEHSNLWSLFRSGMAFALSVVTLLLFPKYVSWLVSHYTRLVERIIKSLHAYTHQ